MSFQDLTKVKAVFFYSVSGSRITAQYYDNSIPDEKRSDFENNIYKRATQDLEGQIMQHEEYIIVYRTCNDVLGFVVGDLKANELLLDEVLETIFTALSLVYKKVSYDDLMKQIDLLYLLLDETIEQGYIFEGDPEIVAARVVLKDDKAFAGKAMRSSQGF